MSNRRKVKVAWRGRDQFAEVAEALHVRTDQIVGAMQEGDRFTVMWSPNMEHPGSVVGGTLIRDADGVLVLVGEPTPLDIDMEETIRKAIEDKLGPPQ